MKNLKRMALLALLGAGALLFPSCQQDFDRMSEESISNRPQHERLHTIKFVSQQKNTKAVAVKDKLWQPGDVIRIKFLNGDALLQEKVKRYAAIWLNYAYLEFYYVDAADSADVKISFDLGPRELSWSTIGTDCKAVPQHESSLNFVWFQDESEEYIEGEVLRGFGHVLGLGFEHRSPASPIVFRDNAKTHFENDYHLSESDVVNDILPLYNQDQTNYTDYDKNSIMVLEIPKTILADRSLATLPNTELSGNDTTFIKELYPRPIPPFDPQVNIDALNAYVANSGLSTLHVIIGLNYDQDEKLPFVATDRNASVWIGYVSQGKVFSKKYAYDIPDYIPTADFASMCFAMKSFIYENELYIHLPLTQDMRHYLSTVYSLDTYLEERFKLEHSGIHCLPFKLNNNKYLGGTDDNPNILDTASINIYNIKENTLEKSYFFNWQEMKIAPPVPFYIDKEYMYFYTCSINEINVGSTLWFYRAPINNLYLEKIGNVSEKGNSVLNIPLMIKNKFYAALVTGEIMEIEENFGRVIYSDFKSYSIAYGNKLYWTDPKNNKSHYVMVKDFNE